MDMGIHTLRVCTLMMPVVGFQIVTSNFFQALGKAAKGTLLSLSRQILFFIPLVLILPRYMGLEGVFFTFPIADFCAAALSAFVMRHEWKELKMKAQAAAAQGES
jgi:Na+-driven multidrug efflux pump